MPRVTIDDRSFEVAGGRNLLETCLDLGFDLPYFCWHPALGSVGACRQCAVKQFKDENDDKGKIVMSCMTPASDGARISIADEEVEGFRASVIEWLMLNHPHDCPVCDEGGECHLQDMTVMTGHDYRRTRFRKRTFRNQDLGPFVYHEMNRCIECYRCVRFYRDHAGGGDLAAFAAHDHVYFGRMRDGALESEFSGNLVEVCPTGVFTDKTFRRHYTRKWDLDAAPSVCTHCGLGCNVTLGARYGKLRRVRNRFHRSVNGYFLCDRGRFGYEFVDSDHRLREAWRLGDSGGREPIGREVALDQLQSILAEDNPVIGIGSPRASLESNYLLRRLVGSERFFTGLGEREGKLLARAADLLRRSPVASLEDLESSDAALVLGEDVTQFAPRAALALRQIHRNFAVALAAKQNLPDWNDAAVREVAQGARGTLVVATPFATRLDDAASELVREAPPDLARLGHAVARELGAEGPDVPELSSEERDRAKRIAAALERAEAPVVVSGTSLEETALLDASARIVEALRERGRKAKLFLALPEANSLGATLLGGGSLEEALATLRRGEKAMLVVLENDLYRRLPRALVDELFERAGRVIVLDSLAHETSMRADLFLPAGTVAESDGTFVSSEGRAQRFFQALAPADDVQESWRWLAAVTKLDEGETNLDAVVEALASDRPELAGVRSAAPSADFRLRGQRVPRESHRYSGRTAMYADRDVHEPRPPADPDSPLAFSMEGFRGSPPPALLSEVWAPGWNSVQALNHYQREVGEALEGTEAGTLLFSSTAEDAGNHGFEPPPEPFARREDAVRFWPVHEIYGSEELSALAPAVASRVPSPYVLLSPADANRLGVASGDEVEVSLEESTYRLRLRVRDGVAPGTGGLSFGLGPLQGLALPAWGHVGRPS